MGRRSSDSESGGSDRYRKIKKTTGRRHRSRSSSYSRSSRSSPRRRRSISRSPSSYSRERKSGRSSQRSRSRDRSRERRSTERSREKRERRSRSREKRDKRSRSRERRSRSRDRRGRSRERSQGRRRSSSRSRNGSREQSRREDSESSRHKGDKQKTRDSESSERDELTSEEDKLKLQVKRALEAAALADNLLREQGLLQANSNIKVENFEPEKPLSVNDQINRVQALHDINAPGFKQEAFVSSRTNNNKTTSDNVSLNTGTEFKFSESKCMEIVKQAQALKKVQDGLAHDNLYGDMEVRQERWIRKLWTIRQRSSASAV